jgi:hypothetical protein
MDNPLILTFALLGWFTTLATLGADRRAGKGPKHRAPGLPRMRRSGTTPRRRATPDYSLAA